MHNISRFHERSVLVLGDIMLDRYVQGDVRRISPEAPIPVLRARSHRVVLGGAGNVAQNIAALGARAILLGVIGNDAAGADFQRAVGTGDTGAGTVMVRVVTAQGRPTTVKTRFMSGSHQMLRLDEEVTDAIDSITTDALIAAYQAALDEVEVVILSDYAKGVLTDEVLERAIKLARAAGRPIIADPKRPAFSAYAKVNVLTPNEMEVSAATGITVIDNATAEHAGGMALADSGADAVLVTRSEKGLTLIRRGMAPLHLPTEAREVADVSGAGDTLVAGFAIMVAGGADLAAAAAVANVAAGIAVGKQGTATVSHAELTGVMHRQELMELDAAPTSRRSALQQIAAWRARGLKIGFTNGCFDLIHPGHAILLNKARARCDRLVVGLNSDASVRRLKGPTRPVQNETSRATVMASMAAADLVVVFDEDTPMELIEAIRPDVLFKGADYRIDQVVGGDLVRAAGGEVVLIDLEEGHSTSNIIKRMNMEPAPAAE
jgi:D-beta-D-heptose 7-phosphate kinase/D-beta-D-heptose 1-phosphate adenosyltransferase